MKDISVAEGSAPRPSRRDELLQLRDRLRAATEANYALDCKIEHLFEPERAQQICNARPYTASIDAALTLVPKGYSGTIGLSGWADLVNTETFEWLDHVKAQTPALALCLARIEYELVQP